MKQCGECSAKLYARGLCRKHYDAKRWSGAISLKKNTRGMSIAQKLEFFSVRDPMTGCHIWSGGVGGEMGYGHISLAGRMYLAHRVAYEEANGKIPDGMLVLHRCDNPPCVNAAHLFLGTNLDNSDDMMRKGRGKFVAGVEHGMTKLTPSQVAQIRSDQRPQRKIAAAFGIAQSHVGRIKREESWKLI